jgi:hypothetical protein
MLIEKSLAFDIKLRKNKVSAAEAFCSKQGIFF